MPLLSRASRLFSIALLGASLAPARAQVPDHLACYRVKDAFGRASYTADVAGLAAHPGCTVKLPAKVLCVEAEKSNVAPAPPGGPAGTPPPRVACYKLKCPRGALAPVAWNDQFGLRTLQPTVPKMLCAPAVPTTTTTSTTLPPCLDPVDVTAARVTEAVVLAVGGGQALDVPVVCGGDPVVCCPGGNPTACDTLQLLFSPADVAVTPTADPSRFAFSVPVGVRTIGADFPITTGIGLSCRAEIDSAPGSSATVQLSGDMLFDVHPVTAGPAATRVRLLSLGLASLENDDVDVGEPGGVPGLCDGVDLGLAFFNDLVAGALTGAFEGGACISCGATALGSCPAEP